MKVEIHSKCIQSWKEWDTVKASVRILLLSCLWGFHFLFRGSPESYELNRSCSGEHCSYLRFWVSGWWLLLSPQWATCSSQPFSTFLPERNPWNNFQFSGNPCKKTIHWEPFGRMLTLDSFRFAQLARPSGVGHGPLQALSNRRSIIHRSGDPLQPLEEP